MPKGSRKGVFGVSPREKFGSTSQDAILLNLERDLGLRNMPIYEQFPDLLPYFIRLSQLFKCLDARNIYKKAELSQR